MRVLASLLFLTGIVAALTYTYIQKGIITRAELVAPKAEAPPLFSSSPPSRALSGILKSTKGIVTMRTRGDTQFREASPGASIRIGESVATNPDAVAFIELQDLGSIAVQENTELNFANLFRENTVLLQKSGKAFYTIESEHPVAIRSLSALVSASSSAFLVAIDGHTVTVTAQGGVLKIAQVDNNNETHVWELEDGDEAYINDRQRSIRFALPR